MKSQSVLTQARSNCDIKISKTIKILSKAWYEAEQNQANHLFSALLKEYQIYSTLLKYIIMSYLEWELREY